MKERMVWTVFLVLIVASLISAGLFDWFKKDVQLAPSEQTNVRIGVGNADPSITNLDAISAVILLPAPDTTAVSFTFTARDANGANDLVDSTASASFTKTGETTRTNPCTFVSQAGKSKTYQCNVLMSHYDIEGVWDVAVKVEDQQAVQATSASTFTVNPLKDIAISPSQIDFPAVAPEQTNIAPIGGQVTSVRNRGNYQGTLSISASNLIGETNPAENIPASSLKASGLSQAASVCSTGTSLVSGSVTSIAGTLVKRGPDDGGSNIEEISYCLTLVPDLSSQFYSATVAGGNAWTIQI